MEESSKKVKLSKPKKFNLYFDGGSRGNPGVTGGGWCLEEEEDEEFKEIANGWCFVGDKNTNNEGEYAGLIHALEYLHTPSFKEKYLSDGVIDITARGDSKLVIEQVNGKWKCKAVNLKPLLAKVRSLMKIGDKFIPSFNFEHVPRAENKKADGYANQSMDLKTTMINIL